MNTLTDTARTVASAGGEIVVRMESGRELRFPVADNPRHRQSALLRRSQPRSPVLH